MGWNQIVSPANVGIETLEYNKTGEMFAHVTIIQKCGGSVAKPEESR
jgi:hypothetical protein